MKRPLPKLSIRLFRIVVVFFFFFFFLSISTGKALSEAEALLKWKASLYEPQSLSSWSLSNNASAAPCRWAGVRCDAAGESVVELSLPNSNLNGTLDALDFASLPNLTALDLSNNLLQGSVPASISSPARLTRLDLGSNGFAGPIPRRSGGSLSSSTSVSTTTTSPGPSPSSSATSPRCTTLTSARITWQIRTTKNSRPCLP
uniref:Leucine-rich repeat-containing N-terminal plant-type domain-containing protein n=1 Tax=Ananas comosus var. bracteatus TaxID=296719 RepID=A0A6V7QM36_ANACO|nr:unnamed protein product [Ananas comosus var. bracteatus]